MKNHYDILPEEKKEEFIRNCEKGEGLIISLIVDNEDDDALDTLVFLLKLVRARKNVMIPGGVEKSSVKPKQTRERWTPEMDAMLLEGLEEARKNGVSGHEALAESVRSLFPQRTLAALKKRIYVVTGNASPNAESNGEE